ncbi:hypothetical protein FRC09_004073 [Ceratobasidium sp. 395]|nr:hypothetical protein FRC09_004073 [Ceratobasidium sp. 395]
MPFTTKRKAHTMQALSSARQVRRPRLDEDDVYKKELARAKLLGDRVIEKAADAAMCTVAHLSTPQSYHVSSPLSPDQNTSMNPSLQLTPLQTVLTLFSALPTSPRADESSHVNAERISKSPTPLPSVSPLESMVCKQEPEDGDAGMELDSLPVPLKINTCTKKAPPSHADAKEALRKINKLLRPPRTKGHSYKICKLPWPNTTFIAASQQAAVGTGRSIWHSRRIRVRIRRFIATGDSPDRKHTLSSRSLLKNEDVSGEIKIFLQMKGKYFVAGDIVELLNDPEVKERLALTKSITVRTAQRWLCDMEYRWRNERPGQYFDGHERVDVVQFRQSVYAPKMKALEPRMMSWDPDTGAERPPNLGEGQRRVIL